MKAVIFDMDGVLINSMKYHTTSLKKVFDEFNLKTTKKELFLLEGMPFKKTINIILKNNNMTLSNEKKSEIYLNKKKFFNEIFKFETYENVLKIIYFLKNKDIKLGLVTGSNKEFTSKIIEKHFKNLFDVIITGDDVKNGKPSPEPYKKAKKKLDFNNNEILIIENSPLGIESGKKAQLKVLALETTLDKTHLKKADLILKNHKELFDYIKNNI